MEGKRERMEGKRGRGETRCMTFGGGESRMRERGAENHVRDGA